MSLNIDDISDINWMYRFASEVQKQKKIKLMLLATDFLYLLANSNSGDPTKSLLNLFETFTLWVSRITCFFLFVLLLLLLLMAERLNHGV